MSAASIEMEDHRKAGTFWGDGSCQTSPHRAALGVLDPNIIATFSVETFGGKQEKDEREGEEECLCIHDSVSVTVVLLR